MSSCPCALPLCSAPVLCPCALCCPPAALYLLWPVSMCPCVFVPWPAALCACLRLCPTTRTLSPLLPSAFRRSDRLSCACDSPLIHQTPLASVPYPPCASQPVRPLATRAGAACRIQCCPESRLRSAIHKPPSLPPLLHAAASAAACPVQQPCLPPRAACVSPPFM